MNVDPRLVQSVRQRLDTIARKSGEDVQRVLVRYAIERLLYRISVSQYQRVFLNARAEIESAPTELDAIAADVARFAQPILAAAAGRASLGVRAPLPYRANAKAVALRVAASGLSGRLRHGDSAGECRLVALGDGRGRAPAGNVDAGVVSAGGWSPLEV